MDDVRELILQDVRCFQDEQRGRLRPITLLVGENSTGKTTFLGCYRVLHRMLSRRRVDEFLDFNEEPFAMGSFRDIVRSRRGPSSRIDEFKIGLRVDPAPGDAMPPYELSVTFHEQGSEPVASSLRFQFDTDAFLELRSGEDRTIVRVPDHTVEIDGLPLVHAMFMLDALIDSPELDAAILSRIAKLETDRRLSLRPVLPPESHQEESPARSSTLVSSLGFRVCPS